MVERRTVNADVPGSNPGLAAKWADENPTSTAITAE